MQLSDNGKSFIKSWERFEPVAYQDQGDIWTAGFGHTGDDVTSGTTCTLDEADAWFDADTASAVNEVNETILAPVSQNQFDALVSFTYNVGDTAEAKSTLAKLVNAQDYARAAMQFPLWDHVGKQVNAGLENRRRAEAKLFLTA
jgi:lysozyme